MADYLDMIKRLFLLNTTKPLTRQFHILWEVSQLPGFNRKWFMTNLEIQNLWYLVMALPLRGVPGSSLAWLQLHKHIYSSENVK